MPWSNNTGGGGPWQPKNNGPWGGGPQGGGGGGGGGGNRPPDLEDIFRKGQDRLKSIVPGGGGVGGIGVALIAVAGVLVWLATGIYTVRPNEIGIERVFGQFRNVAPPGLHYNWPAPIGRVDKPVIAVQSVEIGMRTEMGRGGLRRDVPQESLMLTGDENIVDIDFTVLWRVDERKPQDFIFNMRNTEATVKAVAEAAMREVIGKSNVIPVLTGARQTTESAVQELMQKVLNEYGAGVTVQQVQLQKVDPPAQVIDAFRDVQAARADQERAQNEAQAYANKVVPEARGEAARIIQRAEAEKEKMIAGARGEAAQFVKLYDEYKKAPEVTRQRLFLETIERIYGGMDKVILDQSGAGQGVVPYLPLDQLNRRSGTQGAPR
ncbi:MAG TPA: FtsH protease activity modulator HflK [Beijerinckiaceae bacterium]|nr:FtsH protease activity modulator HflK [Beijerinckiaceae bacterium]